MSQEDMLKYLRENNLRSQLQLEKFRKPTDPNVNDFRKKFESWSNAIRQAFGRQLVADFDSNYMIKAVIQFEIWTVKKYCIVRKMYPEAVPSWHAIVKEWGTFGKLKEAARRWSLKATLVAYDKLTRKLGHIPMIDEIRAANLNLDAALKFYGNKAAIDEFIRELNGIKWKG